MGSNIRSQLNFASLCVMLWSRVLRIYVRACYTRSSGLDDGAGGWEEGVVRGLGWVKWIKTTSWMVRRIMTCYQLRINVSLSNFDCRCEGVWTKGWEVKTRKRSGEGGLKSIGATAWMARNILRLYELALAHVYFTWDVLTRGIGRGRAGNLNMCAEMIYP